MASLSRLTRAALGTTAGVAGVAFVAYEQDEGVRRSMIFWSRVLPIYAHYRWLQYVELPARGIDNSSDECMRAYDVLHERYAPIVERSALELRGFYLKAAQLVSTRDDFVPPAYLVWCKRMQAEVPTPFRPGEGRRIVEKALGGAEEFARTFAHWEEQPCGSASIGVVHRARLAGDGREVAVKVMMPGIESKFRSDLGTIRRFCALAMPQHVSGLDEIDAQFFTEFDYTLEARSMETIHDNLARTRWTKKVVVPRPVPELCSQHVLVMEYLPGVKLDDGLRAQWSRVAERRGVSLDKLEAIERSRPPRELSDSHWRHLAVRLWLRIFDLAANAPRLAFNWTVGALVGVRLRTEWTEVPIDLAAVIRTICDVHAHELFVDGCFNGDPHPGNILLLPDGRIGLVDYGQVKHIPKDFRIKYARLILAIADRDNEEAVRIARDEIGLRTRYCDPEIMWRILAFNHDRDTPDVTNGLNLQLFSEWAEARDPMEFVPRDLVFPGRVTLILRGYGNAFGLKLSVAQLWRPHAERLLREEGLLAPA